MTDTKQIIATCHRCGCTREAKPAKDGTPKLPRGWKSWCESLWCDDCWRRGWTMRAVSMPIASASMDGHPLEFAALRDRIRTACRLASTAANIVIRECVAVDVVRMPGDEKLPPMPAFPPGPTGAKSTHVYHRVRAALPDLDPASVTCIVQAVDRKWRASRLDVVWRRSAAPPSYRHDMPCPIAAAATKVMLDRDAVALSMRIGRERIDCSLVRGAEWRRQLSTLRHVAEGRWPHGEAAVFLRDGRPWAKLCVWWPVQAPRDMDGTLSVRTGGGHMLTLVLGQMVRHVNCDRERTKIGTHDERLRRWAEDNKPEVRPPVGVQQLDAEDRTAACEIRWRRMDDLTHRLAAIVAGLARRKRVARVEYDDTDRSYMTGSFVWHQLAERIRQKVEANGQEYAQIAPEASATVVAPRQESLEGEAEQ